MADLAIVTGSSRGMGAAVALLLLERGYHVVGIARGTNVDLDAAAAAHGGRCEQWRADLADPLPVADRLERWLAARDADRVDSVTLVNNAATLAPIAPLDAVDPIDLVRTLRIGLEAPLVLTAAFLRATARWPARIAGRCRVLNVSSGLGRRPMASQAAYCTVKAGLDHLTRCVALEQAGAVHPARVVSLAPGVIDTDMQVDLRAARPEWFPDHARFVALKADGHLDSPAEAARKIVAFLDRPDFGSQPIADVRNP